MLTANKKYIDTANIKHLLGAGEKNADKIQIAVDRYYHQTDLSDCLFTLRAVNSGGGLVMQNLEKEVTESQIILTWTITEDFTAVSGELLPEIVGQKDDTVVIKYEMTPMIVRNSILEQYNGGIDAIDKALREMQSILAQAEQLIAKAPIIQNGTWWLYDAATGAYQDSGQPAKGDKGETGEKGDPGKQGKTGAKGEKGDQGEPGTPGAKGERGEKGEKGDAGTPGKNGVNGKNGADGYSPTATVTETDAGATITITDKNGTTTATVKNGENAEATLWGDFTPGWDGQATLSCCKAKLVTVMGKQTWQILPSISTASHNALDIVPDGLFVLDLSPDVDALKASSHTHDNKDVLDDITAAKWGVIKDTHHNHINMAVLNSLSPADLQRIQALPNTADELKVLHDNFDDTCSAKTVYVNAVTGSDTQDGSTQANALQTFDNALQRLQYAGKAMIYLAAGTYTVPDKTLTLLGRDVRIYGDTAATTILQGNLVCENSFLLMRRVTIDSTDSTTANPTENTITLQYRSAIRMVDCTINTAGKNAISITEMSNANFVGTTFRGASQYAVYVRGLSDAKIYTCTDETTKGVHAGGGSIVYINNATGASFPYTNDSSEIVFVNGRQVLPLSGSIQFRHGKGTFTATATGTNVVWQYGGQQVQNNKCTFDVKSDNGLICMDFDSITSLFVQSDAKNKMDLSDLGGKITNTLNLYGCPNITGDLSDLGGKITSLLSLYNCTNITGDLSDLGSKITNTLSLYNCTNITGDLSDLGGKIASMLNLSNCSNITGVYSGTKYPKTFDVSKTAITSADMDANLINFAASGVKSGKFTAIGMKRTAASDNAVATLVANGWTVSGLTKEG